MRRRTYRARWALVDQAQFVLALTALAVVLSCVAVAIAAAVLR